MTEQAIREKLKMIGQSHVLRFWDQLDPAGRKRLLGQLSALDLDAIAEANLMILLDAPFYHSLTQYLSPPH